MASFDGCRHPGVKHDAVYAMLELIEILVGRRKERRRKRQF